jgi:hypothetical protein
MILAQEVINRCNFKLDAEGSQRYLWNEDFMPGINTAVDWIIDVVNTTMSDKKFSEEIFRELTKVKVFRASRFSRFSFDEVSIGERLWTVLNIYAEPVVYPAIAPPSTILDESTYMPTLSFISSQHSCARLTSEEWSAKDKNFFMEGSTFMQDCHQLKVYAYLNPANYSGGYSPSANARYEFEISPTVAGQFVAIRYVKTPTQLSGNLTPTTSIELPSSMINLVVNKTLNEIAMKQNNGSTLYQVSTKEVRDLVMAKS